VSCSSSDAAPDRWTVDSHDAKLTIPYLGPEPRPSRIWGIAFLGSCAVAAMVFLVRAALYLRQSALEADLLAHPGAALLDDATSGSRQVSSFGPVVLVVVVVGIVLDNVWRFHRRPKRARVDLGEAYVEFPLKWVTPVAVRVAWGGLALVALGAGASGSIKPTTLAIDYPHHRDLLALSNLGWAGLWASLGIWVLIVNRSHLRRMAFSAPFRADPSQVPYFPSVAGATTLGTKSTSKSTSGASGLGWVVRTAGLAVAFIVGLGSLFGGLVMLAGRGSTNRMAGIPWLLGGAALIGLVVWAMVRRHQTGRL